MWCIKSLLFMKNWKWIKLLEVEVSQPSTDNKSWEMSGHHNLCCFDFHHSGIHFSFISRKLLKFFSSDCSWHPQLLHIFFVVFPKLIHECRVDLIIFWLSNMSQPKRKIWAVILPRNWALAWCGFRACTCCMCCVTMVTHCCGCCFLKRGVAMYSDNSCLEERGAEKPALR